MDAVTEEEEFLAYTRRDIDCGVANEEQLLALVDKLEKAWAERDEIKAVADSRLAFLQQKDNEHRRIMTSYTEPKIRLVERAERAEAEKIRLMDALRATEDKWMRDEAALARIQGICVEVDRYGYAPVVLAQIRAAIEGTDQ